MNKLELTKSLAERLSITNQSSALFIKAFQDILSEQIQENNSVMLQGFGCFSLWKQTARPGRNPRNGVGCTIEARNSIKFKPGKELLKILNTKK